MYTNILHATDLSQNHFDMCKKAADFAKYFAAKLYLIHVIEMPASMQIAQGLGFMEFDSLEPIRKDAISVMATVGEALNIPISQQFVKIGSIKSQVLQTIDELSCDLIITGKHTPDHLPVCLGSTAHSIMLTAPCDVLVFSQD